MRIKKFACIKNIGQFVNCVQEDNDLNLKKYNLIFGENGRGKTTLCAVLRSLQDGNHGHITERITIPSNSRIPEVVINFDAENIVFKDQSWTKIISEIVIFDSTFIAQNIYSGESVTGSHRINLLQVIIGETGVNLMRAIEESTKAIDWRNCELEKIEKEIEGDFADLIPFIGLIPSELLPVKNFKDFLELRDIVDIDKKIAAKKNEITLPISKLLLEGIGKQEEKFNIDNFPTTVLEMFHLQMVRHRYNSHNSELCLKYQNLQSEKVSLEQEKETRKASLDKHGATIINLYQKTINKFLKKFGASFSITNSKQEHDGDAPTASYQILINEHPVDLGNDSTPIGQPCFRTALSAGDRSTLALAFFLAQLDHNPKKQDCVVVFDDPVSSLDHSRREHTAEFLAEYGEESAQLLVFSHDPNFLHLVRSKLPNNPGPHFLQLSRAPDNMTVIKKWDIEKAIQSGYFRDHAILESYLKNGAIEQDLTNIVRSIRPVLEGYLRYRLPNQFAHNVGLGAMIVDIRKLPERPSIHSQLKELTQLNNFSKRYHHPESEKTGGESLTDSELQSYVKRALDITYS